MGKRFEGKRVFLTGASSGIGAAVAIALAKEGARVALAARRIEKLSEVVKQIEASGGHAIALTCDVTSRESIDTAVQQAVDAFGGIDIALANAGMGIAGRFERLSTDDFRKQFETNFFGLVDTIYATLPHLKSSRGQIGLVASVSGRLGTPTTAAYSASKFAVVGLAESIDVEFAKHGIGVTLINPGFVESEIRFLDNSGKFHPDRKDPAPAWLVVSADKAAQEILAALHRRKFEAIITGHGKAIAFTARHFPRIVRMIMHMNAK